MASAQIALPANPPDARWDATRGIVIVTPDHAQWAEARAAYDRLLLQPAPIVRFPRRTWRQRLRRARQTLSLAIDVFLGRRA